MPSDITVPLEPELGRDKDVGTGKLAIPDSSSDGLFVAVSGSLFKIAGTGGSRSARFDAQAWEAPESSR